MECCKSDCPLRDKVPSSLEAAVEMGLATHETKLPLNWEFSRPCERMAALLTARQTAPDANGNLLPNVIWDTFVGQQVEAKRPTIPTAMVIAALTLWQSENVATPMSIQRVCIELAQHGVGCSASASAIELAMRKYDNLFVYDTDKTTIRIRPGTRQEGLMQFYGIHFQSRLSFVDHSVLMAACRKEAPVGSVL